MTKPKYTTHFIAWHPDTLAPRIRAVYMDRVVRRRGEAEWHWLPPFLPLLSAYDSPREMLSKALLMSSFSNTWEEITVRFGSHIILHAFRGTPDEVTALKVAEELTK